MKFFALNEVKNGPKSHVIVQEGLKMHEKRQKIEFLDLKNLLLSGIFLSGIGGCPPPLTDKHCAQKSLADRGGTPPLTGKIR